MIYQTTTAGRTLELAQFKEGVIKPNEGTNYFMRDHLGSTRVVANLASTDVVRERNDFYPFGMKHERGSSFYPVSDNRFTFSGKEVQTTGNLKYLDFGARMYDAMLGRWHVNDPLLEKYFEISPMVYCDNNPIKNIDLGGKNPVVVIGGVVLTATELVLIGTGVITTGAILTTTNDGNISFNQNTLNKLETLTNPITMATAIAGYVEDTGRKWQERKGREDKEGLDKNQANVQNSIDNNIGEPSPDGTPDPKRTPENIGVSVGLVAGTVATVVKDYKDDTKSREEKKIIKIPRLK